MESFGSPSPDTLPETCWRVGCDGRWVDPNWLYEALITGTVSIHDSWLQGTFLDYVEKQVRSEFYNNETHEFYYAPVAKRGNMYYAVRKATLCDEIFEAMSGIIFDEPVPGFRNLRWTRLLFVTLTFDQKQFTPEEAWAALKSTRPEDMDNIYNVINGFAANISKIFGTNGKLVSKEAQANGYPAPHLLIVLDEPVLVRRKKVKGDLSKWYIEDPEFLKRLGKDEESRKLSRTDHQAAIESNPVWKYGFFDIEGVVSNQKFGGRKNVCAYLFKYMAKCITKDHCHSTSSLRTIDECKDHNLLVALYTHLCNKCFRNRDITYGKGFKTRIGLLKEQQEEEEKEPSSWSYMGMVDESIVLEILRLRRERKENQEEGCGDPNPSRGDTVSPGRSSQSSVS